MKYLSILVLALSTSACCGAKNTIELEPKQTKEIAIVTEVPDVIEVPPAPELPVIETAAEIPLPPKPPKLEKVDVVKEYKQDAFNHSRWNKLLEKNVSESGKVDYKAFKNNPTELQVYIDDLTHNTPTEDWNRADKLAYWINAYNALTVDLIIRNYPLKSIKDIKDPWDQRLWQFGDKWQNLNDIEHKILRKMSEPRIHFAIVCASVSCPKLQNQAFTASNLETQLTNATKEFLADSTKNKITIDDLRLSKIFRWFKKDFEQDGSLINFINRYTNVEISNDAKISYMDYNWDLNN